jgi:hypothetical protein
LPTALAAAVLLPLAVELAKKKGAMNNLKPVSSEVIKFLL